MTDTETVITAIVTSTLGSLIGVGVWFHFDLDGHFQHRKHARELRVGAEYERMMRDHADAVREFDAERPQRGAS